MKMNVVEKIIFWLLLVIALGISIHRIYFLFRLIKMGRETKRFDQLGKRVKSVLIYVFGQWSNIKNISPEDLAGFGHLFIFLGVIVFAVNYAIFLFVGEGLGISETIRNTVFSHYFLYLSDIVGVLLLISIASATVRRGIMKPARLGPNFDSGIFLVLTVFIFLLFVCYFGIEGLRINLGTNVFRTPVAGAFADFFNKLKLSQQNQVAIFPIILWSQYVIILGFVIYAPYSHHQHPLFSPFNIFFRSFRPAGAIEPVDFDKEERFGASRVEDFTWKQLLEGFACTHCGRCQDSCPAYLTEKPLSPKELVLDINRHLLDVSYRKQGSEKAWNPVIHEEIPKGILSCTTCGACVEVCPVFNRALDSIIEIRRNLVYEGILDSGHKRVLRRVAQDFNPWGIRWNERAENMGIEEAKEGERYDCLYWLGCAASFDETVREIAYATSSILRSAGVKFAMLGVKEKCCGDFVRRIGDEGLFQKLALENVRELKKYDFDYIVTHCPHCFNTIKNEYRDFGGDFRVAHHTQLILDFLKEGKVQLHQSSDKVIYHDPCYLGRYNEIYSEPRQILRKVYGEVSEFPRNRNNSFCCGAGGAHIWKEQEIGPMMSVERIGETTNADPQIVATACPFCHLMLDESTHIMGKQDDIKVRDIAEIVERYLHLT